MGIPHVVAITLWLLGCGGEDAAAGVPNSDAHVTSPTGPTGDPCVPLGPGCACDTSGATMDCKVYRIVGKYISCSSGTMTCGDDKKWGKCVGAATVWEDDAAARAD